MKNDYYSGTYIPGIVKWGKITLLLGIFAGLLMTSKNRLLLAGTRLYLEAIRVIPILVLLFLFYYSLSRL